MYKLEAVTQKIEINVSSNVCRFWNIPDCLLYCIAILYQRVSRLYM